MELEFGHGFMPRVGEDNYKAVDRCIGPADLFTEDPWTLPWAIIDGAWAEGRPELLDTSKANDTRLLVDTFGWRYRYEATGEVKKLVGASWAPSRTVSIADQQQGRELGRCKPASTGIARRRRLSTSGVDAGRLRRGPPPCL